MGWFRDKKPTGVTPDYTGLQLQTSVSTLPIADHLGQDQGLRQRRSGTANFQRHGDGGGGKGGLFGGSSSGYTYSADLILALVRRADRRHRPHLARPVDLYARQSRPELLQRRDAAGDLGLSLGDLSRRGARLSGHGLRLRGELQPRLERLDRQPQFRNHRPARRHRRQRRRRRPGAGDRRLPHQSAIRRGLRSGQHRRDDFVRRLAAIPRCRPIAARSASPSRRRSATRSRARAC